MSFYHEPRIATDIVFDESIVDLSSDDEVRSWITFATDKITLSEGGRDPLHSITHTLWGITAEVRNGRPYAYSDLSRS